MQVDVLLENFRPGVMEKWGLGPADLKPSLVYTRISGYGQVRVKRSTRPHGIARGPVSAHFQRLPHRLLNPPRWAGAIQIYQFKFKVYWFKIQTYRFKLEEPTRSCRRSAGPGPGLLSTHLLTRERYKPSKVCMQTGPLAQEPGCEPVFGGRERALAFF